MKLDVNLKYPNTSSMKPYYDSMTINMNSIHTQCMNRTSLRHPLHQTGDSKSKHISNNPCIFFACRTAMLRENQSHMTEFLLLKLTSDPKQQVWLFASFLTMYLINVIGNSVIIAVIQGDTHLHTPMYFFLSNLSLVDTVSCHRC